MSTAKVKEITGMSPTGFDDAIKSGIARANKTLGNIKSAWVENQQIMLDDNGQINEYRVQLMITYMFEE
ncbi:MAG: dodecin domain-containing protein [Anaerolineae bacterium]|nr:MAG: dodecin domain-containing protein [Anaerolineae bacterium]